MIDRTMRYAQKSLVANMQSMYSAMSFPIRVASNLRQVYRPQRGPVAAHSAKLPVVGAGLVERNGLRGSRKLSDDECVSCI